MSSRSERKSKCIQTRLHETTKTVFTLHMNKLILYITGWLCEIYYSYSIPHRSIGPGQQERKDCYPRSPRPRDRRSSVCLSIQRRVSSLNFVT